MLLVTTPFNVARDTMIHNTTTATENICVLLAKINNETDYCVLTVPRFLKNFDGICFAMSTVQFAYTPVGKTVPHQPIVNGNRLVLTSETIATNSQTSPKAQRNIVRMKPIVYKTSPEPGSSTSYRRKYRLACTPRFNML